MGREGRNSLRRLVRRRGGGQDILLLAGRVKAEAAAGHGRGRRRRGPHAAAQGGSEILIAESRGSGRTGREGRGREVSLGQGQGCRVRLKLRGGWAPVGGGAIRQADAGRVGRAQGRAVHAAIGGGALDVRTKDLSPHRGGSGRGPSRGPRGRPRARATGPQAGAGAACLS